MSIENATCPRCHEQFDIDTDLAAFAYRCPHCRLQSGLEGLRSQRFNSNNVEIHKAAGQGIAWHLFHFTIAILYQQDFEKKIASGTLVRIGHRYFLMTAGHVLNAKTETDARYVSHSGDYQTPLKIDTANVQWREYEDVDVGFIEFGPCEALDNLHAEPLHLDRVLDLGSGITDRVARVYGYPSEVIEVRSNVLKLRNTCLGTTIVPPELWSTIDRETRYPQPDRDVVLRFDRADDYWSWGREREDEPPPKPYGMSGGGCWHGTFDPESKEIWTPDASCLFAIQSRWPRAPDGRFLIAAQVIHWLRLVADNYPDLEAELLERYPRIIEIRKSDVRG